MAEHSTVQITEIEAARGVERSAGADEPIVAEATSPATRVEVPAPGPPRALAVWIAPAAWAVLLLLALYFFQSVSTVLMGVLAACIISSTLRPVLGKVPGPRGVGLGVIALGLMALVGVVGFLVAWPLHGPIERAIENWPGTRREVDETLLSWSGKLALQDPLTVEKLGEGIRTFLIGGGGQAIFRGTADVALGILLALAFALIGSIFLLTEPADVLVRPMLRLAPLRYRPAMGEAIRSLGPKYRAWVIGTLTGMTVVFCASALGYTAVGLKMALPMALLAGFAEVVPTVGPAISGAIVTLLAAATDKPAVAVGVFFVWLGIQAIEAYVVLPMIMRGAVNIHPAVTLFTVILWGKIFGVPGIIMAIPINLTIWTLLEQLYVRPMEGTGGGG
jgi:predicted PurR-regulated permease PerM